MNNQEEKLSDQLDIASALEQKAADVAINAAREAAKKPEAEAVGHCLFCAEEFPEGDTRRWCDADCRNDWELEKKFRRVV